MAPPSAFQNAAATFGSYLKRIIPTKIEKIKEKLEDNFVLFFDSKFNMELDKTISTEIQIGFERNC